LSTKAHDDMNLEPNFVSKSFVKKYIEDYYVRHKSWTFKRWKEN